MSTNNIVPLAVVAVELGTTADELAARLGDVVTLDDTAIRCIPADAARDLIANRRARIAAERDRKRAELEAAQQRPLPLRERVRAIARQQERFAGADVPALGVLLASDIEDKQDVSAQRLDEMLGGERGVLIRHPIGRRGDR